MGFGKGTASAVPLVPVSDAALAAEDGGEARGTMFEPHRSYTYSNVRIMFLKEHLAIFSADVQV